MVIFIYIYTYIHARPESYLTFPFAFVAQVVKVHLPFTRMPPVPKTWRKRWFVEFEFVWFGFVG